MFPIDQIEFGWLIGLLEGEGSFLKGTPSQPNLPRVAVTTTDHDVAIKLAKILDTGVLPLKDRRYVENHWKQPYFIAISGAKAVVLMREVKAYMSHRRQLQIEEALSCYSPIRKVVTLEDVSNIRAMAGKATQAELAKIFKVSRETVNRILTQKGRYNFKMVKSIDEVKSGDKLVIFAEQKSTKLPSGVVVISSKKIPNGKTRIVKNVVSISFLRKKKTYQVTFDDGALPLRFREGDIVAIR